MSTVFEPAQAEERWLTCRVDQGMFSDELAVTYPASGQHQKSVFVERTAVEGSPGGTGRVRVRVIERDGNMMAVLPSPTQDIVYVQAGDITGE